MISASAPISIFELVYDLLEHRSRKELSNQLSDTATNDVDIDAGLTRHRVTSRNGGMTRQHIAIDVPSQWSADSEV